MLLYNIAAAALMAWARFGLGLPGLGVLPTAVMHALLAGWCVASLTAAGSRTEE